MPDTDYYVRYVKVYNENQNFLTVSDDYTIKLWNYEPFDCLAS